MTKSRLEAFNDGVCVIVPAFFILTGALVDRQRIGSSAEGVTQ